jgi:hypothetical protein
MLAFLREEKEEPRDMHAWLLETNKIFGLEVKHHMIIGIGWPNLV